MLMLTKINVSRGQRCIFIGYPEEVKRYNLWESDDFIHKILINSDTVFNEEVMYIDISMPSDKSAKWMGPMGIQTEVEHDLHQPITTKEVQNIIYRHQLTRHRTGRKVKQPLRFSQGLKVIILNH